MLANKTTKSQPNCFWSNLFLSENPTSNNSFQILINFSLVFKITPKVGVYPIPLQHKLELLVIHFFWREIRDVTCNLPITEQKIGKHYDLKQKSQVRFITRISFSHQYKKHFANSVNYKKMEFITLKKLT